MINDVASKEREREKSFGDGTKRTKWETIEKKVGERERSGPFAGYPITPCDKQEMRPDISR